MTQQDACREMVLNAIEDAIDAYRAQINGPDADYWEIAKKHADAYNAKQPNAVREAMVAKLEAEYSGEMNEFNPSALAIAHDKAIQLAIRIVEQALAADTNMGERVQFPNVGIEKGSTPGLDASPATKEQGCVIPDTALLEVLVEKVADAVSHDLAVYGVQNDDAPWDVAVRAVNVMRSYVATQCKPVSVKLEKCIVAIEQSKTYQLNRQDAALYAKAVLDAAGVKYVE